jgi:hypothetical protein
VDTSLPGQTLHGIGDGFTVTYDNNGNHVKTDEFGVPGGSDEATDVSGDGGAVYVTGEAGFHDFGFVRKYGLDGSLVQTADFWPPDYSIFSSSISADPSGVYVFAGSAHTPFAVKFDSGLNQVWKFTLQESLPSMSPIIAVGSNGVYFAGYGSTSTDAYVWAFSRDSSLILFWLNPPYSFAVLAAIPTAVVLALLVDRRWRNRRETRWRLQKNEQAKRGHPTLPI